MTSFRCLRCQRKITVPDSFGGRRLVCPSCNAPALVPGAPLHMQGAAGASPPAEPGTSRMWQVEWVDYLRASKASVVGALLVIALGSAWLLNALHLFPV